MSELVFIGTGDAFGAGGRRQSAMLLRAPGGSVLLDCGATTCAGLCELGIDRKEIDAIVISHFHGDHYAGIPILLLAALYEDERKQPLRIVGPPGVERRVHEMAAAMCYDIKGREWPFPILFQEYQAGEQIEVGPAQIRAFQTLHQPNTSPHGLLVDTGAQRIAYSGDTGWLDELPHHIGEADLFVCECTYYSNNFDYHLSHEGLLARKHEFECGRIILTHLGFDMTDRRGQVSFETAEDGMTLNL
jgi:ribonuclease BN (tRNA processing enzyme)